MILVTGTKRSGTSLWMQVLTTAGFETIGSEFPFRWERSIGAANPEGFYESKFRSGINWTTNPHPETGRFLFPDATRRHVVKVFIPGLVRSDYAYLDHVIATVRPWREYVRSLRRLFEEEDAHYARTGPRPDGKDPVEEVRKRRSRLPPEVGWWAENYQLIRDIVTRRYPYHLVTHSMLLRDPEATVADALAFLGGGDRAAGAAVVRQDLYRSRGDDEPDTDLDPETLAVFDELYEHIDGKRAIPVAFLAKMNEVEASLRERFATPSESGDVDPA